MDAKIDGEGKGLESRKLKGADVDERWVGFGDARLDPCSDGGGSRLLSETEVGR